MSYGVGEQRTQAHICWFSLECQALKRMTLHNTCPVQPHLVLRFKNLRDSQQEKLIMLLSVLLSLVRTKLCHSGL